MGSGHYHSHKDGKMAKLEDTQLETTLAAIAMIQVQK